MSGPIWDSYADADLTRPCPNCSAKPDVWCARPDGRVRRTPCLARMNQAVATYALNGESA